MDRQDDIPEDDDLGDGEGGGFRGNDDDSQALDQSIPQVPPNPHQQPHPPMPQPRPRTSGLDGALPPISTHLSNLANVLASRAADGYLNDFQQTWGSRLPGPGAGVASVRPGGHVQRETRKRKADGISRSAAEMHSFACIEDLSERGADRLLTFTTNVIVCVITTFHCVFA